MVRSSSLALVAAMITGTISALPAHAAAKSCVLSGNAEQSTVQIYGSGRTESLKRGEAIVLAGCEDAKVLTGEVCLVEDECALRGVGAKILGSDRLKAAMIGADFISLLTGPVATNSGVTKDFQDKAPLPDFPKSTILMPENGVVDIPLQRAGSVVRDFSITFEGRSIIRIPTPSDVISFEVKSFQRDRNYSWSVLSDNVRYQGEFDILNDAEAAEIRQSINQRLNAAGPGMAKALVEVSTLREAGLTWNATQLARRENIRVIPASR